MGTLSPRLSLVGLFGLGLIVVLTGCRTYGDYGSEAKIYEEMGEAVEELEAELESAQADLQQLRAAAEQANRLEPLLDRYQTLVEAHEALIQAHEQEVNGLSAEASHRTLRRSYGAMVTDRRLLRRRYDRTVRRVYGVVRDSVAPSPPLRNRSTYSTTPVNFPQPRRDITMVEALRPVEGQPGLQEPGEASN